MVFVRLGRGGVCIGLCVMMRGGVEKLFSEVGCVMAIENTKRGGSDKVYEGVQGRFVVTMIWYPLVVRKEGHEGSGVGSG